MSKGRISLVLFVLVFLVFAQVAGHQLVDWDDSFVITDNPVLAPDLSGAARARAIFAPHHGNWIPLTQLSLVLTRAFAGPEPAGFLIGNFTLHALSAVLLFLALARMTGALGRSAFVAAVFAVHPLHVESVAWATERKDVLAGLFFSLTLLAYARFAERPDSKLRYALVLVALACGLLSKPTIVTLPFVLLLLDFWPLGRLSRGGSARRVWLEKLPMLALALAAGLVTLLVQRSGGGMEFADRALPLGLRLWNALDSYGVYLAQTVWPVGLSVFYPHPVEADLACAGAALGRAAGGGERRRARARAACALSAGRLALVPGHAGPDDRRRAGRSAGARGSLHVPPAPGALDRRGVGRVDLVGASPLRRRALAMAAAVLIAVLAVAAHHQVATWRDSLTLFGRAVALDPDNLVAQHRFAVALRDAGRLDEAQQRYQEILRREPRWALPWLELGGLLEERGDLPEALRHYQEGLRLRPSHAAGQASLGRVLLHLGRPAEARACARARAGARDRLRRALRVARDQRAAPRPRRRRGARVPRGARARSRSDLGREQPRLAARRQPRSLAARSRRSGAPGRSGAREAGRSRRGLSRHARRQLRGRRPLRRRGAHRDEGRRAGRADRAVFCGPRDPRPDPALPGPSRMGRSRAGGPPMTPTTRFPFTRGLHELGNGCFAFLQPDGGWGWSNAGLVTDAGASLLVDTLFDLALTREMLAAMRRATPAAERIGTLVNTHANGDHCYGNSLVQGAEIIASKATAEEMGDVPPALMQRLLENAEQLGPAGAFFRRVFGRFDFRGIEPALPTRTFERELTLPVGSKTVRLLEVGPAHTRGDVLVHVAAGSHRLHRRHPVHRGHADRLGGARSRTGSAPASGSRRWTSTSSSRATGRSPTAAVQSACASTWPSCRAPRASASRPGSRRRDAARDIELGAYADWRDPERIAVNVETVYRELRGGGAHASPIELFGRMAELARSGPS